MSLNSILYLLFLTLVSIVYYLINQNQRKYLLILASFIFIGFKNMESVLVLILTIIITYSLAKKIQSTIEIKRRKNLLRIGIVNSLAILFLFKYFDFHGENVFKMENIFFALGISFYTLQNISFLVEVHSKRLKLDLNLVDFTVYSSFFPKFIMGPIALAQDFFPQINDTKFQSENILIGFKRILVGLVKKIVIADSLSTYVHFNFDMDNPTTGLTSLITAYLFTLQLYFDFSGYSDIALGSAKILRYDLKENFTFPLRSVSITEFWRNWHISLTSWLTKYIFYPISYRLRKLKKIAIPIALLITFLLSGLWHGIGFTFLIYAVSHALYMCFEYFTKSVRLKLATKIPFKIHQFISIFITFNLVSLSFVFFRANSIDTAIHFIKAIFNFNHFIPANWNLDFYSQLAITGDQFSFFNLLSLIIITIIFLLFEKKIFQLSINNKANYIFLFTLIFLLFVFGIYSNSEQFIYNQF